MRRPSMVGGKAVFLACNYSGPSSRGTREVGVIKEEGGAR
jgi:hypothetical protein